MTERMNAITDQGTGKLLRTNIGLNYT
jgi:hypothetical protein